MFKPELLLPAGNLEKLKIAFKYGADACYVGGNVFGLRKFADNFSENELKQAVDLANELNKKVYIVLNGFAHNTDIDSLTPYFDILQNIQPHAFIISDMGVFKMAKEKTTVPIHISTQASVTNGYTCKFLQESGAKRVVLAREVTIAECADIQKLTNIELELFVHGAQCASYSGKCVISNYASGRDSNRGGCVQSCRHSYDMRDSENDPISESSHIMNAKDLMSVNLIPEFIHNRIHSFKVEGRMKSNLYVANTASTYRAAIDDCVSALSESRTFDPSPYEKQLRLVSNRRFSTGGLSQRPFGESIHYPTSHCTKGIEFIGTIKDIIPNHAIFMEVKIPFLKGDILTKLGHNGKSVPFWSTTLFNMQNEPLEKARPNSIVKLPWQDNCNPLEVIHREVTHD